MNTHDQRPTWWQLFLLLSLMIGLVALEAGAPFSESVHTAATVGILVLTYALVGLWVRANRLALRRANHLVTLLRRSQGKAVRREQDEGLPVAFPLQAMLPQTGKGSESAVERGPREAVEPDPRCTQTIEA